MGERRISYRVLVGKTEGNKPFRIPWRRWEDNTKVSAGRARIGFICLRIGTVGRL
jgi:hypothetical protein